MPLGVDSPTDGRGPQGVWHHFRSFWARGGHLLAPGASRTVLCRYSHRPLGTGNTEYREFDDSQNRVHAVGCGGQRCPAAGPLRWLTTRTYGVCAEAGRTLVCHRRAVKRPLRGADGECGTQTVRVRWPYLGVPTNPVGGLSGPSSSRYGFGPTPGLPACLPAACLEWETTLDPT